MRPLFLLGLCLGSLPGLADAQQAPAPGLDAEERAFLDLLNQYRRDNGLGDLVSTLSLNTAADRHAFDMASNDWFDHTGSDGSSPSDRCAWAGYPGGCGENLAAGYPTARDAFEGWRASPGHNANMLSSDYAAVGVALEVAEGTTYTWYWATDFGFVVDGAACACTDGELRECASSCGPGVETCTACSWSACDAPTPAPETCNGLDDDCNGIPDDAPECAPPPEPEDEDEAESGTDEGSDGGSGAGPDTGRESDAPMSLGYDGDPGDDLAADPGWYSGIDPDDEGPGTVGLSAGCSTVPGRERGGWILIIAAAPASPGWQPTAAKGGRGTEGSGHDRNAGHPMEIDQLRTFLAILEHGSFSRAAESLHVGQSTVSFHVKMLEQAVGTRLLDRLGGRVRATAAGKLLRRYASRIVSLREEALSGLRAEERGEAGRIAIAASTIPAECFLPRALAVLRVRHPGVAVTVDVSDSRRATVALVAEECDLALVGARTRDKRIIYTPFADDEVVLCGPLPNPFAPSGRLAAAEIGRVPLIVREDGSGTRGAIASLLARHVGQPGFGPVTIQVGSTQMARRCVIEGLGLTFISRRAVEEDLHSGRLGVVALAGTPVKRRFFVARLRSTTPSAAARTLMDVMVQ